MSFDVVSVFTSVPVTLVVLVAHTALERDENLSERTNLNTDALCRLTELRLNATYFSSGGEFNEQASGTMMKYAVSATAANMKMEHIEKHAHIHRATKNVPRDE